MIKIRRSKERGYENKGWLETYHTFSFDTYYDPKFLGYHDLLVLNEDVVKGGKGFGAHSHKDIEILTYVLKGTLEHQDSMGNTSVVTPGEVLHMSAGTGVVHSEYNLSHYDPVHFLQIWIRPDQNGLTPSYSKRLFPSGSKWGQWCLIGSRNGREGSLRIHQDVEVFATILENGEEIRFDALFGRHYWIQVIEGKFLIEEETLSKGDAASLDEETTIEIRCMEEGELLLFDLA